MRLFSIGDIHGCAKSLDALVAKINPLPDDHLIFIGDYIDRGPDSKGVIDRLIALQQVCNCTFLRGNHEAMMLDYMLGKGIELWEINGGIETLESYRQFGSIDIPDTHREFLKETKMYHDEPAFFFVHAGLKPDKTIKENITLYGEEVFLWERSHLYVNERAWEKPLVCGHTPHRDPILNHDLILIDTGCVYSSFQGFGKLTAVQLPQREIIQVDYVG